MFKSFALAFIAIFCLGRAYGQNFKVLKVYGTITRHGGQIVKKGELIKGNDPVEYNSPKDGLRVFSEGKIYLLTPPGTLTQQTGKMELLISHFIRKSTPGSLSGKDLQVPYCYLPYDTLATLSSGGTCAWYTGQHFVVSSSENAPAKHAMLLLTGPDGKLSIAGKQTVSKVPEFEFDLSDVKNSSDSQPIKVSILFYNDPDHIDGNIDLSLLMLDKAGLLKKIDAIYKDGDTQLFCPKGDGHKQCLKDFIGESLIATYGLIISQPVDKLIETYLSQYE